MMVPLLNSLVMNVYAVFAAFNIAILASVLAAYAEFRMTSWTVPASLLHVFIAAAAAALRVE